MYVCVGLYRLQNIHSAAAESSHVLDPPSFIAVRATGVDDFHASLRRIDASHVTSRFGDFRFGDSGKCIVLDFSTEEALTTILRQVNQSVTAYLLSPCKFTGVLTRVRYNDNRKQYKYVSTNQLDIESNNYTQK